MPSASDEEIIKKCEDENRILITDDKDFGELVFRLGKPTKGDMAWASPTIKMTNGTFISIHSPRYLEKHLNEIFTKIFAD